ncbi:MAG: hypothetical protein FJ197_11960 [Gammaproteobacteria bacterium]|nr:hypothetical protein [Gammaproteobacteria bacterium]
MQQNFHGKRLAAGVWLLAAQGLAAQPADMPVPSSAVDVLAREEFTEEDFAQFFGLIVDGRITRDKMATRCAREVVGFTFAGADLSHDGGLKRIDYNQTRQARSVDGRALRSRHFNVSLGEWSGAVYKPLCPGLYALSVDFVTADAGRGGATDTSVHVYLRRKGEARPGTRIVTALKPGKQPGAGHASLVLPLRTFDEISTWSEGADGRRRLIRQVTFTAHKVDHLEKYVEELDVDAFNRELLELRDATPPAD